jgi:hypothetical protein
VIAVLAAAAAWATEPVPLVLPAQSDALAWAEVAAGVGLEIVPPGAGAWAEIAQADGWVLVVHDPSGKKRIVAIEAPTTRAAREDVLLLAVSLLRPFSGGEKGWATPPPPPRTWKPVEATLVPPPISPEPPPPWIEAPEITIPPSPPGPKLPTISEFSPTEAEVWASFGASLVVRGEPDPTGGVGVGVLRDGRFRVRVGGSWAAPTGVPVAPGPEGLMSSWGLEAGAGDCYARPLWGVCGVAEVGASSWRFRQQNGDYVGGTLLPKAGLRLGVHRTVTAGWRIGLDAVGSTLLGSVYVAREDFVVEPQRLSPLSFEPTLTIQSRLP